MALFSILIPVLNEEKNLTALFRSLNALEGVESAEILFIDNGSEDESLSLLKEFQKKTASFAVKIVEEKKRGFPEPLNAGLKEADGDVFLFLDADAVPEKKWLARMAAALDTSDIAVGETKSALPKKPSVYGRLAKTIFDGYSARAASAETHPLPWGPTCNLGARRELFLSVGNFSEAASSAFDIDWCWRAVLQGARLRYAPKAVVRHARRNEREAFLRQMERYGRGEAWLANAYAFLSAEQTASDLLRAVDAFQRLKSHPKGVKSKSLAAALEEASVAFACGVMEGSRTKAACRHNREMPKQAIFWERAPRLYTVFVPGKGIVDLTKEQAPLWEAFSEGSDEHKIALLLEKRYRLSHEEAHHEAAHFMEAFSVP